MKRLITILIVILIVASVFVCVKTTASASNGYCSGLRVQQEQLETKLSAVQGKIDALLSGYFGHFMSLPLAKLLSPFWEKRDRIAARLADVNAKIAQSCKP